MPDFETIKLAAPYWAELPDRDGAPRRRLDGDFECLVPCLARKDTIRVARLVHTGKHRQERYEFRLVDGRLFRPFRSIPSDADWTWDRLLANPPLVRLAPERSELARNRTSFLHSPFRPECSGVGVLVSRRARQTNPEAFAETAQRLQALGDGLRLVEGTLFQETRPPAWSVNGSDEVRAILPDFHDDLGLLVDPRYGPREMRRQVNARRFDRLELFEPSLLPDTIEADALAGLCRVLHGEFCTARDWPHASRFQAVKDLFDAVERALAEGGPFDACYRFIRDMEALDADMGAEGDDGLMSFHTGIFRQLLDDLPPMSRRPPAEDDIDPASFRP